MVLFLVAIVLEGCLILPALGLGFLFDVPPFQRLSGATWGHAIWGLAAALPPTLVVILLLRARVHFALHLLEKARTAVGPLLQLPAWQLLLFAMTAGLVEETLFRGVIQTATTAALISHLDGWVAQAGGLGVGALLFGLAHPTSRAYVIAGALFGVWMGGLLLMTGNLLSPMVTHAVYDFILILYVKHTTQPEAGGCSCRYE